MFVLLEMNDLVLRVCSFNWQCEQEEEEETKRRSAGGGGEGATWIDRFSIVGFLEPTEL